MIKMTYKVILLMFVVMLYSAGCAKKSTIVPLISPVPKQLSDFKEEECEFGDRLPPEVKVTCGNLSVPEDRNSTTGPKIQISVVVFKSNAEKPQPDPLLILMGYIGPLTRFPEFAVYNFGSLAGDRDLIIADLRGTDDSEPNLNCPELRQSFLDTLNLSLYTNEFNEKVLAAYQACRNQLSGNNINLSAYTAESIVEDLEDLRIALGYDEWNIYSSGYSTRLALELMRKYPDNIRSVVLDTVYPPQVYSFREIPMNAQMALKLFFQRCTANDKCNAAFPNVENVFFELVDKYNAHPIMVTGTDLSSGEQFQVLISGDRLIDLVISQLTSPSQNSTGEIPRMIFQLQKDNTQKLSEYLGEYLDSFAASDSALGSILYCAEEVGFVTLDEAQKAAAKLEPELRKYFIASNQYNFDVCGIWNLPKRPDSTKKPVKSDVPALLMAGDYFWVMPPAWAKLASQNLKSSYFFEFPETGIYVVFSSLWAECSNQLIEDFFTNPNKQPDSACTTARHDFLWITLP